MGRRTRNSLPHSGVWFVTTTTREFRPVFMDLAAAETTERNLNRYSDQHKVRIYDYVIMPHHLHLMVETRERGGSLPVFMRDLKKGVAFDLKNRWDGSSGLWVDRFDDLLITNEDTLGVKLRYILNNPVKAGLVDRPEDYRFSSVWCRAHPGEALVNLASYAELGL